ncbi:3957_t:CDS:1 [Entrophospora sp. SA101]|nr:3957_t:CDS:1 [Entrophospora sp. SA101]CAJ0837214.1 4645_t:CDS:1 [Entrophospora sp. SA101]
MTAVARLICNSIDNVKIHPEDLLPSGVINIKFLQQYNYPLYKKIKKEKCLDKLKLHDLENYKVKLSNEEKNFINHHIKHGYSGYSNILKIHKETKIFLQFTWLTPNTN